MKNIPVICTTLLVEKSPQALPLGAACVASALKTAEIEASLLVFSAEDSEIRDKTPEEQGQFIADRIVDKVGTRKDEPFVACFSVYVWNRFALTQAAKILKEKFPKAITIAGGPEVTANPKSFSDFSVAVSGEGEIAVPELITQLQKKDEVSWLPSIVYGIQSNPDTLSSPYLDGTLDPSVYGGALWELARGCPFKCSYCYESKGEKKVVYFPLSRLEQELRLFAEKEISQVFVLDPTYNADKKRAVEMLNLIQKITPDIFYHFECRAEFIDKPLAKAFARNNCSLQIGLQSAHEDVLAKVHRSFDKKKFIRNIGFLNDAGAIFGFDLIYGLPGDTLQGVKDSMDFALQLYPNHLELFRLSVLPGTDLFDRAKELQLEYLKEPPYHVTKTSGFTPQDLDKAEELATACNIFYSAGRSVSWFISLVKCLKVKPVAFLSSFAQWMKEYHKKDFTTNCMLPHLEIEKLQIAFVNHLLSQKRMEKMQFLIEDIIHLNGAYARCSAEKETSVLSLHYNIDDLLSPYAQDLLYFAQNAKPRQGRYQIFFGKNGVDYKKA